MRQPDMNVALFAERYELLPLLAEMGMDIAANDAAAFRQAVLQGQLEAVHFFLDAGIDVNTLRPDTGLFPHVPTAVFDAVKNNDFPMLRLLVEYGAEVAVTDRYGDRPFSFAVRHKNREMMAYLAEREPSAWHDEELKVELLKKHHVPDELIDFLRGADRKLMLSGSRHLASIEFLALAHIEEKTWKRKKVLNLLVDASGYDADLFLVWYPAQRCLASIDYEHDRFVVLGSWATFIADPGAGIDIVFG